ncbi:MAG: CsbD family protein [Myxococcales bacterium]
MNQDQVKGVLGQLKGRAKVIWGEITNNENIKADGSVDKLYGLVQQTFGDTKELLKKRLDKIKLP